ncbi:hypothetical protein ACFL4Y_03250 [Gemmatimonadota bacterium]
MGLALIFFASYPIAAVVTGTLGQDSGGSTSGGSLGTLLPLLLVCLVDAAVLTIVLVHGRWWGWRLVAAAFVILFGAETFLSQMETFYFSLSLGLPTGTVLRFVIAGAVRALLIAPAAVLLVGRMSPIESTYRSVSSLPGKPRTWWRGLAIPIAFLAIVYAVVYIFFGYFVAWQSGEVRAFYSGSTEIQPFLSHIRDRIVHGSPGLVPFQLLRGVLWAGLARLVVVMTGGSGLRHALLTGILFGCLVSMPCVVPNPYLPTGVRMVHFIELLSSMLLFGAMAGWLLARSSRQGQNLGLSRVTPSTT